MAPGLTWSPCRRRCANWCRPRTSFGAMDMNAIRWRSATTPSPDCSPLPTAGWTPTAAWRGRRSWRRRFENPPLEGEGRLALSQRVGAERRPMINSAICETGWGDLSVGTAFEWRDCHPTPPLISFAATLPLQGRVNPRGCHFSIRSEHELAVTLEIGAGAHVELAVLPDEEQRALRHLLCALQQQAGIVGPHFVGVGLAILVVTVAHIRLQLPRRRRFGKRRRRERSQYRRHHQGLDRKSCHVVHSPAVTRAKHRSS